MKQKPILPLNPYNTELAFDKALQRIEKERSGIQIGLLSRFPVVNKSALKYFRADDLIGLGGMSGSGKSYVANMLRTDFTDTEDMIIPIDLKWSDVLLTHIEQHSEFTVDLDNGILYRKAVNSEFDGSVVFLDFIYEMTPVNESLRTISTLTGYNYAYLLSSQGMVADPLEKEVFEIVYNSVTDEQYSFIEAVTDVIKKRKNILMFNTIATNAQIYETVKLARKKYPNALIVVKIDHTLLIDKLSGTSDVDLQAETIKYCIRMKNELNCLVIPIIQTNSNMEDDKRRLTPALHFPTKKDLYAGGQVFQGCDLLYVMVMPQKINISAYSTNCVPTRDLIHMAALKVRNATGGNIWLHNSLGFGKIQSKIWKQKSKVFNFIPNLTK